MEPIIAEYAQDNDDWTITVSGAGQELTARAPGIIAARDCADQLVDKLTNEEDTRAVHLLNGSAFDFTATYIQARLSKPTEVDRPADTGDAEAADEKAEVADKPRSSPHTKRNGTQAKKKTKGSTGTKRTRCSGSTKPKDATSTQGPAEPADTAAKNTEPVAANQN